MSFWARRQLSTEHNHSRLLHKLSSSPHSLIWARSLHNRILSEREYWKMVEFFEGSVQKEYKSWSGWEKNLQKQILCFASSTSTQNITDFKSEVLPFKTIKTFFHWVFPTLGVWQKRILCLSHTNIRSRTNFETIVWVRFFSDASWHTFLSSSSLSIWITGWFTRSSDRPLLIVWEENRRRKHWGGRKDTMEKKLTYSVKMKHFL